MNYYRKNRAKVIVLATLFVAALIHRSGIITRLLAEEAPANTDSEAEATVEAKAEQGSVVNLRHFNWPDSNLENLLTYSPFGIERPPEPTAEEQAETEDALAEILLEQAKQSAADKDEDAPVYETQRLKAVFHSSKGPAAMVGSRIVHVGDTLEDGSRIVAIRNRELILELQPPDAEVQ